jgi:ABC-2 type transport system permease protein
VIYHSRFTIHEVVGVVGAVARRELLIIRRYPSWILGIVVWPVLFPLAYLFSSRALAGPRGEGLSLFAQSAGTANYVGFIVIGAMAWMWLNITLWGLGTSLRAEQLRGTLESNWLSPAPRFAMLMGTAAGEAIKAGVFFAVSVVGSVVILRVPFNASIPGAAAVIGLSIPWVYGLGMAFAAGVLRFKEANAFVYFVRGVFLIFAGISFPLAVLPEWMHHVAGWLPLTHTIIGLRAALLDGAGPVLLAPQLAFLAYSGLVLGALGYATFRVVDAHVRRTGAVWTH